MIPMREYVLQCPVDPEIEYQINDRWNNGTVTIEATLTEPRTVR